MEENNNITPDNNLSSSPSNINNNELDSQANNLNQSTTSNLDTPIINNTEIQEDAKVDKININPLSKDNIDTNTNNTIPNEQPANITNFSSPNIEPVKAKVGVGSELTMFLARLGCVLNNYNIALAITVPILFAIPIFYGLALAFNFMLAIIATIFMTIITLGLILLEPGLSEFIDSLLLFKPENASMMGEVVFEKILPNAIVIFITCSIASLILHIIGRKHTSVLRYVWSIICVIISVLFLALYFINQGGLSA